MLASSKLQVTISIFHIYHISITSWHHHPGKLVQWKGSLPRGISERGSKKGLKLKPVKSSRKKQKSTFLARPRKLTKNQQNKQVFTQDQAQSNWNYCGAKGSWSYIAASQDSKTSSGNIQIVFRFSDEGTEWLKAFQRWVDGWDNHIYPHQIIISSNNHILIR